MKARIWALAFTLFLLTIAYAVTRPEFPVGCALRSSPSFSPTGSVAKYRCAGYVEAMEVIYHSSMTETAKTEALVTLVNSVELEKYIGEAQK